MSLTERLGPSRAKELATFLLKVEFPAPTRRIIEPLLEMVRNECINEQVYPSMYMLIPVYSVRRCVYK